MNYHNITTDDMLNGDGLRTVLWVAGCEHKCVGCQNPMTWKADSGILFDAEAKKELFDNLHKSYISGVTFSGGDPLYFSNRSEVLDLAKDIRSIFGDRKSIWLYTGYLWEEIKCVPGIEVIDVIVDGRFVKELAEINYPWAGSTNQRIIDVKKSLESGTVVLYV